MEREFSPLAGTVHRQSARRILLALSLSEYTALILLCSGHSNVLQSIERDKRRCRLVAPLTFWNRFRGDLN